MYVRIFLRHVSGTTAERSTLVLVLLQEYSVVNALERVYDNISRIPTLLCDLMRVTQRKRMSKLRDGISLFTLSSTSFNYNCVLYCTSNLQYVFYYQKMTTGLSVKTNGKNSIRVYQNLTLNIDGRVRPILYICFFCR